MGCSEPTRNGVLRPVSLLLWEMTYVAGVTNLKGCNTRGLCELYIRHGGAWPVGA